MLVILLQRLRFVISLTLLFGVAVVAVGCEGRQAPTPLVATPTTTPAFDTPTATPLPDSPTPTPPPDTPTPPTPTSTPVPPPTPTPTPIPPLKPVAKMAFVPDELWHRVESNSITDKNTLIRVLNDIATNYPTLCDVIIETGPVGHDKAFFVDNYARVLEGLVRIAHVDEGAAVALARMGFHTTNEGPRNFMPFFVELAEKAPEDFAAFLGHPDVPVNITLEMAFEKKYSGERTFRVIQAFDGSYRTVVAEGAVAEANRIPDVFEDLLLPFLEVTDPQAVARVAMLYDPDLENEILRASVIRFGNRLAVYYPDVFAALVKNLGNGHTSGAVMEHLYMIAQVDESIAVRVASMPFVADLPSGPSRAQDLEVLLGLLGATLIDLEQTHAILDMYEQETTVAWPDLDGLTIELLGLFRPEYATRMKSLPWIQDGISSTTPYRVSYSQGCIGQEERYSEKATVYTLSLFTRRGHVNFVDAILQAEWMNNEHFNWLRGAAVRYLRIEIDGLLVHRVIEMPFLETLEARDLAAIKWIGEAMPSRYTSSTTVLLTSFMRLLEHSAIGGEITDDNQDRLEEVTYEIGDTSDGVSIVRLESFEKYISCDETADTDG